MIETLPRPLRLLGSYDDGRDARHFRLRIEQPGEADRAVLPGQFFMLGVPGLGEAPFTYVCAPDAAGEFCALIRRCGQLTAGLFESKSGALLGYRGPFGQGWPELEGVQSVLVVAGGCGLAPLAGWIDRTARQRPELSLRVLYGARSAGHQVLASERERWRSLLPLTETLDEGGEEALRGSPLGQLDRLFAEAPAQSVLCCGPEGFMLAIAKACVRRGVAAEHIWLSVERRMHCAVGVCGHCYIADSYACVDGPTYRYDQYRALLARANVRGILGEADVGPC